MPALIPFDDLHPRLPFLLLPCFFRRSLSLSSLELSIIKSFNETKIVILLIIWIIWYIGFVFISKFENCIIENLQSLSLFIPRHEPHSSFVISPLELVSQYFQKFFAQPLFRASRFTDRRKVLNSFLRSLWSLLKLDYLILKSYVSRQYYLKTTKVNLSPIFIHFIKLPVEFCFLFVSNCQNFRAFFHLQIFAKICTPISINGFIICHY